MERQWIITSYLDIRGFGSWTANPEASREFKDPFISRFYQTMEDYVRENTAVHGKYVGDGFMGIKEFTLQQRENGAVYEHMKSLKILTRRALADVQSCGEIAPKGILIRHTDGYSYKIMMLDPNDPERKRLIPEYVEYVTNTAANLKEVNPEILSICTLGVAKALGKYGSAFRVRPLGTPSAYPKSVNRETLEGLQILDF
jgi:hypothetical protein